MLHCKLCYIIHYGNRHLVDAVLIFCHICHFDVVVLREAKNTSDTDTNMQNTDTDCFDQYWLFVLTDTDTSLTDTNNPKNTDICSNRYRYMVFLGIG